MSSRAQEVRRTEVGACALWDLYGRLTDESAGVGFQLSCVGVEAQALRETRPKLMIPEMTLIAQASSVKRRT